MEPTIIRRSRTTLYGCVIAGALSIFIFFFGPFGDAQKMYNDNTGSVVFFFLLCSGLLVYGFIGLFAKKGEIILSEEAILSYYFAIVFVSRYTISKSFPASVCYNVVEKLDIHLIRCSKEEAIMIR